MGFKEKMKDTALFVMTTAELGLYDSSKKKPKGKLVEVRTEPKIGRNEPCPCGSGKKYKKCCINN